MKLTEKDIELLKWFDTLIETDFELYSKIRRLFEMVDFEQLDVSQKLEDLSNELGCGFDKLEEIIWNNTRDKSE